MFNFISKKKENSSGKYRREPISPNLSNASFNVSTTPASFKNDPIRQNISPKDVQQGSASDPSLKNKSNDDSKNVSSTTFTSSVSKFESPSYENKTKNISTKPQNKIEELDFISHFTQRANKVIFVAQKKAEELGDEFFDSEHLLFALLKDPQVFTLLTSFKISPPLVEAELSKVFRNTGKKGVKAKPSPRAKRILNEALLFARKIGFEFVSPEHILYSLYKEGEGMGARILKKFNLNLEKLEKEIAGKKLEEEEKKKKDKFRLEDYTIDLTEKAAKGELDPVVERSDVIERVVHILSRRRKNNPVLIGEAGVGKTAIVEGLAQRIVEKKVPESLLNKKILQLDLMLVLAGASHRGEFEERMKKIIDKVKESQGEIILFIDEIHNIVGAGAAGEGSLDASNFLKPPLARGEIQVIGATTVDEYRRYIEKDAALERRFQPVLVPEPTVEQAIAMLKALRDKYEAYHKVKIPDRAIEAAVKLSKRYVGDRFLPDKAVDLIDEAAAAVRLPLISLPEEMNSLERRIKELEQELQEAIRAKNKVEERILRSKIQELKGELEEKKQEYELKKAQSTTEVTVEIIKQIISSWTGIPLSKITESEAEKLLDLENIIHKRLIDQERAVKAIAEAIRRSRAGLKSEKRPIGGFLFLGPTGVGKTELAKTLADVLFGDENALIRFDMTEYMQKHEVAKLLGAPPGYVGYEEGGKLTEAVRRRPYSVVLFDEIEKAHPDIFNILLQILDDGRLTDNKGRVVSFKNTVVICTSNIGSELFQNKATVENDEDKERVFNYEEIKNKVLDKLKEFLRPELINRFDEILVFEPLSKENMRKIIELQLKDLGRRLNEQTIGFEWDEKAVDKLLELGFDPAFGARPLRRAIQKNIENELSSLLIAKKIKPGDIVKLTFEEGKFKFEAISKEELEVPDSSSVVVKNFYCEKCGNNFQTEVVANSTVICPKCVSSPERIKEVK